MNAFLWILQILIALHTIMGAIWKFSNSEQTVASLSAIPHVVWLLLIAVEILCSLGLILPVLNKRFGKIIPLAAVCIAGEMLFFCIMNLMSAEKNFSEITYWLIVATLCGFLVYGRMKLKPVHV